MITATPTKFEIYDEAGAYSELLAKIEMIDGATSALEIKTCVSPDSWPELARVIQGALELMHPKQEMK